VNLTRGFPRFNPGEYTAADVLARREADAALIIASDPLGNFSQPAREHLARISHHFFESSRFGGTWGRERESFGRSGGESALS